MPVTCAEGLRIAGWQFISSFSLGQGRQGRENKIEHTKVYRPDTGACSDIQDVMELSRRRKGQFVIEGEEKQLVLEIEPVLFRLIRSADKPLLPQTKLETSTCLIIWEEIPCKAPSSPLSANRILH